MKARSAGNPGSSPASLVTSYTKVRSKLPDSGPSDLHPGYACLGIRWEPGVWSLIPSTQRIAEKNHDSRIERRMK